MSLFDSPANLDKKLSAKTRDKDLINNVLSNGKLRFDNNGGTMILKLIEKFI